METYLKSLFSLLIPLLFCAPALNSLGPPRLVMDDYQTEYVVAEGSKVQLPCPVLDSQFFEWYHGNEPLNIFHEDRFRVQSNGVLRIKSVEPKDSGVYHCKAVNGFGKVETNVTLIVLATENVQNRKLSTDSSRSFFREEHQVPPYFTNVTRGENSQLNRVVGESIRLICKAEGNPEPQITWLKDARTLNSSEAKRNRWSLYLKSLKEEDKGNYTCIAYNLYGHCNYTVVVSVLPGTQKKPEIRGIHPVNTTVEEGGSAIFQCRIKSEILPHVQWLKQADPNEAESTGHKIIKIHGEYFRILKSSEVLERPDGSYLYKLIVAPVSRYDSGKYVCLGANTVGYTFRSAYLNIPATSETFIAQLEDNDSKEDIAIEFSSLLITIPVVLVILIILFAFLLTYFYHIKPNIGEETVLENKLDQSTEKHIAEPSAIFPNNFSLMNHPNFHGLDSSDGTWSHVHTSMALESGHPDSFSECDSSFVFLKDVNMYPDMVYKDNSLYPSHLSCPEKNLQYLDRV